MSEQNKKMTNPFGHIAIRIEDRVYTTYAEASERSSKRIIIPIPLKEYLYGYKAPKGMSKQELADVYGQLWARNIISLRIQGFKSSDLSKMISKISEIEKKYQQGKFNYQELNNNCSHHILKIMNTTLEKKIGGEKSYQAPLSVFNAIYSHIDTNKLKTKFVFYEQIYEFDDFILPEFKYKRSKYPLNINLYKVLSWYAFDKRPPVRGELETNANFRLAYYPKNRVLFENLDTYRDKNFSSEKIKDKDVKRVVIPTFDDGPLNRNIWKKSVSSCPSEEEFLRPLNKILEKLKSKNILSVFYVSAWGDIDLDSNCPTRTEPILKKIFQQGLKKIEKAGHLIAIHSYKHTLYRNKNFDKKMMYNDIIKLKKEIAAAGVKLSNLWRTPYGSHALLQNTLKKELNLVSHMWELDSFDYLEHDDSPVKMFFSNKNSWRLANQFGLAYTTHYIDKQSKKKYIDILFHVNERTANNLDNLLRDVEVYLEKNAKLKFSDDGQVYWSRSIKTQNFDSYLRDD